VAAAIRQRLRSRQVCSCVRNMPDSPPSRNGEVARMGPLA
jgi:hypothetical protein